MPATEHTQSLSDFRRSAVETFDRLNESGQPEILTENGVARAVLLSPAVYEAMSRELLLSRDLAAMQRSRLDIKEGKVHDIDTAFSAIRAGLMVKKITADAAK